MLNADIVYIKKIVICQGQKWKKAFCNRICAIWISNEFWDEGYGKCKFLW